MKKFLLFLFTLMIFTSCLSITKTARLSENEKQISKQNLTDIELFAASSIDTDKISSDTASSLIFDSSMTSYRILPQYDNLIENIKNSYKLLFKNVLDETMNELIVIIENLKITDPEALLNESYQSITWEIENQYKTTIYDIINKHLVDNMELYLNESFTAFTKEASIWRENKAYLAKIKDIEQYPQPALIELSSIVNLLGNTLLSELAFSEQRIRTAGN